MRAVHEIKFCFRIGLFFGEHDSETSYHEGEHQHFISPWSFFLSSFKSWKCFAINILFFCFQIRWCKSGWIPTQDSPFVWAFNLINLHKIEERREGDYFPFFRIISTILWFVIFVSFPSDDFLYYSITILVLPSTFLEKTFLYVLFFNQQIRHRYYLLATFPPRFDCVSVFTKKFKKFLKKIIFCEFLASNATPTRRFCWFELMPTENLK